MMKRAEFMKIVDEIEDCIMEFEKRKISSLRYGLVLSNCNSINFCYDENFIPHMLGINTYFLKKYGKDAKAYESLKYFLENSFSIFSKLMKDGEIDENQIFSPYIEQKIKVFKSNICFSFFNILCVVEIDREKTYTRGDDGEQLMNANYLLVQRLEQEDYKYGILAFAKNHDSYSIISSMGTNDLEYFGKYFYKQNLTLPYYLTIDYFDQTRPPKKFWLPIKDIYNAYTSANVIKHKYSMSFCLEKYYELLFNEVTKQKSQNEELNTFLKTVIQNIMDESMVTKSQLNISTELNNSLDLLVDAYNNSLFNKTPLSMNEIEQKQSLEEKNQKIENLEQQITQLEANQKAKELELKQITQKYEQLRTILEAWQITMSNIQNLMNNTPRLELEKK